MRLRFEYFRDDHIYKEIDDVCSICLKIENKENCAKSYDESIIKSSIEIVEDIANMEYNVLNTFLERVSASNR